MTGTGVGVAHPPQREHPLVRVEVLVVVGQCFGVLVITVVFLGCFLIVLVIVTGGHAGLEVEHLNEKESV